MSKIVVDGVPYEKSDGECAHPTCRERIDFSKWDKPPPGWATLSYQRYGTRSLKSTTFVVCPKHTVTFGERQTTLITSAKKLVRTIVESPFAGDVARNLRFVRAIMRDCLLSGEAPYASHALYTQEGVLDDTNPEERRIGMEAGFAWADGANKIAVYSNYGLSPGMQAGIDRHKRNGKIVEIRQLKDWETTASRGLSGKV